MKDPVSSVSQLPIQLPELSLQVISFIEIGFYIIIALLLYYFTRRLLMMFGNTGALEKRTLFFQLLNISTFILPGFVFLYGLTSVSEDSLFVSLLFFVIFSIIFGFSLVDPARNLLASLIITVRGDLKVGDYISINKTEGEIYAIGALNVLLINKNGARTFVPTHHILQQAYEVHAKKGGPSIMITIPSDNITKKNLERLAHLCPFKRKGSDVRISTLDGSHKLSLEIVNRESRSWVVKYFDRHTQNI